MDHRLFLFGAATLVVSARQKGSEVERAARRLGAAVPEVLPTVGGMLLWGATADGDAMLSVDRGEGRWTVCAYARGRDQWYEFDQTVVDWLVSAFRGEASQSWLVIKAPRHSLTILFPPVGRAGSAEHEPGPAPG